MINLPSLFITGTDTGVGKTVVTALLGLLYQQAGLKVGLEKPVLTGAVEGGEGVPASDISFLKRVVSNGEGPVTSYSLSPAVSPHLAAALSGTVIDLARIEADHVKLSARCSAVLVEGAGGLLVPLNAESLMADLAVRLRLPVLIVSRPSLGTINHTLLTVSCARERGLQVVGIIIGNYPASPGLAEIDNPKAIEKYAKVPVLAVVPQISGLSVEEGNEGDIRGVAQAVNKRFGLLEQLSLWRKEHAR